MTLRLRQIILQHLEKIFLIYNKIKTVDDQIKDEKLQGNIDGEAAKISGFSSNKFGKYEYLTVEKILPFN